MNLLGNCSSGKIGQQVAAPGVTVIDQGNLPGERGSIPFSSEGEPSGKTVLIENGVLKSYMRSLQDALRRKTKSTGNGRRQDFKNIPITRMTVTYIANGTMNPEDIIKSVKYGMYFREGDVSDGQVNKASGKFNMNTVLGFMIRDGEIDWTKPLKGATLIGDGPTFIQNIDMVGNDLKIEKGAGTCGKKGQALAVSVGQPTIRAKMTVGGPKK
ncbi:MAG: TldD/PmbA family protein [Pseudomonadota bacterium]